MVDHEEVNRIMKWEQVYPTVVLGLAMLWGAGQAQESWQLVYQPEISAPLQKIHFPSDKDGWILTSFPGAIAGGPSPEWEVPFYRTHDGGRSWQAYRWPPEFERLLDPTMNAHDCFLLDSRHVWIVGYNTCLWTTDAGQTWARTDPALLQGFDFAGVSFADTLHGWAIGFLPGSASSWLGRTADAGETWEFLEIPDMVWPYGVLATGRLGVVVVGAKRGGTGLIVRTQDGGSSFSESEWPERMVHVHKVTERLMFALGEKGLLLHSEDAGVTWQVLSTVPGDSAQYNAFAFADSVHGLVAAGQFVLYTEDDGRTWNRGFPRFTDGIVGLTFSPSQTAWAISRGQIWRSPDLGQTWVPQLQHPSTWFGSVSFADENIGLASGTYLFRTADGGTTWERNDTLSGPAAMISASSGWLLTKGVGLFATRDGGMSWTLVDSSLGKFDRLYADSLGKLILWSYDGRSRTTDVAWSPDAGVTWRTFAWTDCQIEGFHFRGQKLGWAFGASISPGTAAKKPIVLRTTDGGQTWRSSVPPAGRWEAAPVTDVRFADSRNGWAADGHSKIWRSKDGGDSWSLQLERSDSEFNRLWVVDTTEVWAAGMGIFRTVDGGRHWSLVGPEYTHQVWWQDVCFLSRDLAFFVGESKILRWSRHTGVVSASSRAPREFHISACYPNPFNEQTRIVFSVPALSKASLVVFDAAGRIVRTLLFRTIGAGKHTVLWDGRDDAGHALPSGLYIVRLSTGDWAAIRKVMLVR